MLVASVTGFFCLIAMTLAEQGERTLAEVDGHHSPALGTQLSTSVGEDPTVQPPTDGGRDSISKNARKKALKAQRLEELKPAKRQAERERRKAKRAEARLNGTPVPPRLRAPPEDRRTVRSALVIDLGFDSLMTEKEIASMTSQLSLLYSCNRIAHCGFESIILCGPCEADMTLRRDLQEKVDGPSNQTEAINLLETTLGRRMEGTLRGCWRRWKDVKVMDTGGLQGLYSSSERSGSVPALEKDKIVYLTADAEETLDTIEDGFAYVIGGLVDRNRHKNVCANKAKLLGVKRARLPISADRLKTSRVLTVNQVVQILLAFNECKTWNEALNQHLPQRKIRDGVNECQ